MVVLFQIASSVILEATILQSMTFPRYISSYIFKPCIQVDRIYLSTRLSRNQVTAMCFWTRALVDGELKDR